MIQKVDKRIISNHSFGSKGMRGLIYMKEWDGV